MAQAAVPSNNLGEILLREGVISEDQFHEALRVYESSEKPLSRILTEMEAITEGVKLGVLQKKCECKLISLSEIQPRPEAARLLNRRTCEKYHLVPLRIEDDHLVIAMDDPTDSRTVNAIEAIAGKPVMPLLARSADIASVIEKLPEDPVASVLVAPSHSTLYRILSFITLPVLVASAPLAFILTLIFHQGFQTYFFHTIEFTLFEQVLVFVLGFCAWAVIAYWIDGVLFDRERDEDED